MINESWCDHNNIQELKSFSGDFNKANLKTRLHKFDQHIECATQAGRILDHCYSNFCNAYKALPRLPFGKSDQDSILLLPTYRQKLKQETPVLRSVKRWSRPIRFHTSRLLRSHMFRIASDNNIDVYADSVSKLITKCIGDVVPTETIKTFPNQKLWIDGSIRAKLKAQTTVFNHSKATGNMTEYKQCSYSLLKAIKHAKRQQSRVAMQWLSMWQGLQSITDYKKKISHVADTDILLPGNLNNLFARFEDNAVPLTQPATKTCGLSFTAANTASLAVSSEHVQTSWLVCLRIYSINPYPGLLFPHASRGPPLFLFPRKLR
ncbi:unnamed protein product [Oncorhynchus mykiss]|uniref:Uncharacterized protein n=1 Tax=Oncorhynchus mykiss TaxID=8022 RepID=A0A060W2M4_ONCMY|nr:unnamed protein product [Oncorhynchus mykiss]